MFFSIPARSMPPSPHVQPPAPGHAHHVRVVHRRDEGRTVAQVDEAESLRRYLPQLFWGDLHPVGVQSVHQHRTLGRSIRSIQARASVRPGMFEKGRTPD